MNAHISWPRACHVQVHSGSHAQTHARLHMAMHARSHQARLLQKRMRTLSAPSADTVHDARSDLYHWRVIASSSTMRTICKTFAAQPRTQVRKHVCGNAREMLNACALERERPSVPHFEEDQNCMATHMSCAHIAFKRALEHLRIHMYACRPDVLIARNKRLPRNDNAEFIHGRARQCVWDAHWSYERTARHRCGPHDLSPSRRHAKLARESGRALAHHIV